MKWLGGGDLPKTIVDSYFNPISGRDSDEVKQTFGDNI